MSSQPKTSPAQMPTQEIEVDKTKACWKLKYELKKCLMESPCIMEDGWTSRECLTNKNARIEPRCRAVLTSYRTCRRQIFDMRARFRGRKGDF